MKMKVIILTLLIGAIFASQETEAQSTIFNAPSTDVISKDRVLVEADFISHAERFRNSGFQAYGIRAVYGIGKNLEAGANVFTTRSSNGTPVEIQPNLKWKAYASEKYGFAVAAGTQLFVPLNKAAGDKTTAMVYVNSSKVIAPLKRLRVTGGAYTIVGATPVSGTKSGAIVAFEQPLHKRVNFVGDWFSGKNRVGYSAIGLNFVMSSKQTLTAGYNFGNSGRGNNAFAIFYGYTF